MRPLNNPARGYSDSLPEKVKEALTDCFLNTTQRNQQLNYVDLLLGPSSPPQQQRSIMAASNSTTTMWKKSCHKAIVKMASVPNRNGASAIFKLFQARLNLLEKQLKQPLGDNGIVGGCVKKQMK